MAIALALRRQLRRPVILEIFVHARGGTVTPHFLDEDGMDTGILILIVDLIAAFLDAGGDRDLRAFGGGAGRAPLSRGQRIADAADAGGEIARRHGAGVEM